MRVKNMMRAKEQIKYLLKRIDVFSINQTVIGDINKDIYVQFVPVLKAYYYSDDGELIVREINNRDLRKIGKAPDGSNWKGQLLGISSPKDKWKEKGKVGD